jgi:four helix bundle protein
MAMNKINENKGYKKLIVWQKADDLAYKIYKVTKNFPKEELYGMISQLRRAALSVPLNLVEGAGRQGKGETRQFANIALGSLAETKYLLEFSLRMNYIKEKEYKQLNALCTEIGKLLWRFYKSI